MSDQVDLCGVVGNTRMPDDDGIIWSFDITSGLDSPDHQIETGETTGRPGASLYRDEIGARLLAVDATARTSTAEQAEIAWRKMKGQLPPRRSTGELVVHFPSGAQKLTVRRAYRPIVTRHGSRAVKGLLQVMAIDNPFLVAAAGRTPVAIGAGSTGTLTNDGDEAAYLVIQATGTGTVILQDTDSGKVFQTRISVGSGTIFDGLTRNVNTGGTDIFPMASASEWLYIPPQGTLPLHNIGTAPVSIASNDAFA